MNTQEFLAVTTILKACSQLNCIVSRTVSAVDDALPEILSSPLVEELHQATVRVRIAVDSLQPALLAAITQVESVPAQRLAALTAQVDEVLRAFSDTGNFRI